MKPESRFIKAVHDELHPDVYREKMYNPLRGGTPDVYYMGYRSGLWVEYKWVRKVGPKPQLSPLQLAWLMRAWDRGQSPWVVVGSPAGCVVLRTPTEWVARVPGQPLLSKKQLARSLEEECGLEFSEGSRSRLATSTQ